LASCAMEGLIMDKLALISLSVLILVQGADIWTTIRAISSGQGTEANPVMAWVIDKFGLYLGTITPKALFAALVIVGTITYPFCMTWINFAITAPYLVLVYRNYKVVK